MARYYFSCPKIYFGEEAITSLCQFNNKRVGIVTDDFMMSSGKTRYLISHMPEASVCIFGEVTPDPDIDILTSGAARFKAFKPDVIIALGGGSDPSPAELNAMPAIQEALCMWVRAAMSFSSLNTCGR